MIRLIDHSNAGQFAHTLDQHFRLRHAVFVKEKGWTAFDRGAHERDDFDTVDAVYAVLLGVTGEAIGCFRLYPTTLPHMLSETFPHLVDGAVLARPDIMELSRFHIAQAHRDRTSYLELLAAIPEAGLKLGLSGLTALVRTLRVPVMQAAGLTITPLGLPVDIDGESHVAVLFETSQHVLDRINDVRRDSRSVFEHDQPRENRC